MYCTVLGATLHRSPENADATLPRSREAESRRRRRAGRDNTDAAGLCLGGRPPASPPLYCPVLPPPLLLPCATPLAFSLCGESAPPSTRLGRRCSDGQRAKVSAMRRTLGYVRRRFQGIGCCPPPCCQVCVPDAGLQACLLAIKDKSSLRPFVSCAVLLCNKPSLIALPLPIMGPPSAAAAQGRVWTVESP